MTTENSSKRSSTLDQLKQLIRTVFPVNSGEWTKLLPICAIFFAIVYVYDLLRIYKSSMVSAQSDVGVEVIPYIKVYGVIPSAILLAHFVFKLLRNYRREQVFQMIMAAYMLFYVCFAAFVYPNQQVLNLMGFEQWAFANFPSGIHGLISMISRWPSSLFYIATELWSSIAIAMVFWGFVNEVSKFEEAARFYPLYLLSGNWASVFAGYTAKSVADYRYNPRFLLGNNVNEQSVWLYVLAAVVAISVALISFSVLLRTHPELRMQSKEDVPKTVKKKKMPLLQSLKVLAADRHLFYIAVLVISYNFVFNLSDFLMETQLKSIYHSNIQEMTRIKGEMAQDTGYLSVFISLFVTGNLIRRFGWGIAAYATPVAIAVFGLGFYGVLILDASDAVDHYFAGMGLNPAHIAMWSGYIQIVCSRGFKYTLFDTSKEMTYIPLTREQQRIGKAAIDGVGSRVGKSFGAFAIQVLLNVCPPNFLVPCLSVIAMSVTVYWIFAISRLARKMV